ncbi:MAG: peptidase [Sulfuricurvum sp. PC08-66]|nr:MAG: peptidase [Sulfuricurvum sp. PC08-66]
MALALLGIGNVLACDDGVGVYACHYVRAHYSFSPQIHIVDGGVEGMALLDYFATYAHVVLLDAIAIEDEAGAMYIIPAQELAGYGLNSGGAHEVGAIQCMDMLELLGKPLPQAHVIGIVPHDTSYAIALSIPLREAFGRYIETIVERLSQWGITATPKESSVTLEEIIEGFRVPKSN